MPISYKRVETALSELYAVPAHQMRALKGRISNFQRLGIVSSSPGRGKRIDYELADAWRWALGLQLAACGVEPANLFGVLAQSKTLISGAKTGEVWILRRAVMSNWVFEPASTNDGRNVGWSKTQVFVGSLYAELASRLGEKVKLAA